MGYFFKRIVDIVIGLVMLIVFAPIMLICMIAIKIESPGPAIFVHKRSGLNGKCFKMYKLRGMVDNALEIGPELTQINDPRLTKTGKLFRRLSLDEIPQFYNVIKGEMTLIGPRPEIPSITERYNEHQKKVFNFKPGITGVSQINGRQTLSPEERVQMEIEYYSNATFWSDFIIFLKTPHVVITNDGNI
jgi:lipopolysaccharide/colanic/teichoic acid biosynthesis glycosyltransferase